MADKKKEFEGKKSKSKKEEKGKSPHIETEPVLDEAILSPMERRKRSITFKKYAKKIAMGRRKAERKAPDKERLKKRAQKQAIKQVRKDLAGERGKNYDALGAQEKSAIDKRVQSKKTLVDRIAKRILPKVKKAAAERRSGRSKKLDEAYKNTPTKRPHELFTKDGKIKHDRRFKINRKIVENLVVAARKKHEQEKDRLETKQKRELRRARVQRANREFRKEDLEFLSKNILGEEFAVETVVAASKKVPSQGKGGAGEQGTDKLAKKYVKDTPYMTVEKIEDMSMGEVIKDFQNSDDPRFKGKSKKKRREMAIAAKMATEGVEPKTKVSAAQLVAFEKFVDRLFSKFDIDFEFSKHFADRINDKRNTPDIELKELADIIQKIYKNKGKSIKSHKDVQAVIKDLQSDLNMPVVIDYDDEEDEFYVTAKTIMRKKDFKTSNPVLKYK